MKLQLKSSLQVSLITCLLLLGGCGKKNTVNSSAVSSSTSALIQGLQISCLNGRNRVPDVNFFVSGSMTGTTVYGQWQSGSMPGTTSNSYVGVSAYRDVMILTKVVNGSQVLGYNLTLSFCEVPNAYPNYPALVSSDRPLVNFQAPNGITINTAVACGYGTIAAALNTVIISQKSMTNPYTWDYPIYTSFTRPLCNGQ